MDRETKKDNERKILTADCHDMDRCQHRNLCMLLEISGWGEVRLPAMAVASHLMMIA